MKKYYFSMLHNKDAHGEVELHLHVLQISFFEEKKNGMEEQWLSIPSCILGQSEP